MSSASVSCRAGAAFFTTRPPGVKPAGFHGSRWTYGLLRRRPAHARRAGPAEARVGHGRRPGPGPPGSSRAPRFISVSSSAHPRGVPCSVCGARRRPSRSRGPAGRGTPLDYGRPDAVRSRVAQRADRGRGERRLARSDRPLDQGAPHLASLALPCYAPRLRTRISSTTRSRWNAPRDEPRGSRSPPERDRRL